MRRPRRSDNAAMVFLVLAVALLPGPVSATEYGHVHGRVLEAFSGRPIPGAELRAAGLTQATDAKGQYDLQLPAGRNTLEISAVGHPTEAHPLEVIAGADVSLDIYLVERPRLQETVEVTARVGDDDAPATILVHPADVMRVAGGAENIFRTLQTLPGVSATEEFGSRLAVRGGGPDENLTVMDGVEIHNPYRLFGLTSAFNPETVRGFELYTGAFAAKYGDRLSSLLVVENRDGAKASGFSGSSALSITDANVVLEGKLPGASRGSWLVTGRRTYYDLVAERFTDSDLPAFADLQGRATWTPRTNHRLTLFGLRSREATDATFTGDRAGEQGSVVTAAHNDVAALQYATLAGERLSSQLTAGYTRSADTLDVDAQFRNDVRRSNAPAIDDGFSDANVVFTRDLEVRDLSVREQLAWQASGRHAVEAGFEVHGLRTSVVGRIEGDRNPNAANGSSIQGGTGLPALLDSLRNGTRTGAYLQERWQTTRSLVLEPGLRFDHSNVNQRSTVSPRLRAVLAFGPRTRLRAGVGLFTQSPGYEKLVQSDYFFDLTGSGPLPLDYERARHAMLGVEHDFAPGLVARVEGYYKRFDQLIVGRLETQAELAARVAGYDFPASLQDQIPRDPQITSFPENSASGRAYGFEAYVARRAASSATRLTGWASYGWGRAERDQYQRRYPFEYDRRHAFSLVGDWRASAHLGVATTVRIASGFPRTPIVGLRVSAIADTKDLDHDGNTTELIPERDPSGLLVWTTNLGSTANLNSARLPLFARVDLRVNFSPRGASGRWLFYLDVINALNRSNTGAYQAELKYNPDSEQPRIVETSSQSLPFVPSVGIRFRF